MTIRELLENSRLPKGTEQLLEPGPLPAEEGERILALALEKAKAGAPEKGEEKPMKKTKFGLMLLAAALCVGTVAASAAAYFQMDKNIARDLGAEDRQELLAGSGTDIQTSQECDGWVLSVNQAVGDRNCAYILLDVTAPEGTVLAADLYQIDARIAFNGGSSGGWGWHQTEDEDKTDNLISFILDATMDTDLRKATGELQVTGLTAIIFHDEDPDLDDEVEQVADLTWAISFPMDYEDDPITYKPGRAVEVDNGLVSGTLTVEKVEITPLSISMKISGDQKLQRWVEAVTAGTPREGAFLVDVLDRDGNRFEVSATSGREHLGYMDQVITFQPIIDPADVATIVLAGVEIPLTK